MYAEYYKANWWVWLVSGAIAVIFGLLFLNYPDQTFQLITLFFGIFALLTGLTFVVGALANRKYTDHFWSTLWTCRNGYRYRDLRTHNKCHGSGLAASNCGVRHHLRICIRICGVGNPQRS